MGMEKNESKIISTTVVVAVAVAFIIIIMIAHLQIYHYFRRKLKGTSSVTLSYRPHWKQRPSTESCFFSVSPFHRYLRRHQSSCCGTPLLIPTNVRVCVCGIATPLRTNNKRWTHPCRDVLSRARSSAYVAVGIAYHQLASSLSWPLGHRHHLGWARGECNTLQETKHYHRYNGKQENGKGKSNPQFNYYWENRIQNALSSRVKARYFVALRKNKLDKKIVVVQQLLDLSNLNLD